MEKQHNCQYISLLKPIGDWPKKLRVSIQAFMLFFHFHVFNMFEVKKWRIY